MATIQLPIDFKEFLQLLRSEQIEYLLVGGYAVGYYGYPRATGDLDIWIAVHARNANGLVRVLKKFGFASASLSTDLFVKPDQVIRMGVPPLRIELLTGISGVHFTDCYANHTTDFIDGIEVDLISLEDLRKNKAAAGRAKDQDDLEHLP